MQKNPINEGDSIQEPMTLQAYEDAVSLPDGIYPITDDAGTVLDASVIAYGNETVEDALKDLQYHVVATSAASGTIASKLGELAAVYSTLTAEQKMGCLITIADTDILRNFDYRGLFYEISMSGSAWVITSLQLNNNKAYSTLNGATPTDNSSNTNAYVYKLYTR